MKGPRLSVIVPNYNHKNYLQQRLESIFNQTFQDFEVILLDDASTDASEELFKQYETHPKVSHLVINKTNSGSPFKQWQKGIELAKGEYIWIAESDDYNDINFLSNIFEKLRPSFGLCYTQTIDVNEVGDKIAHREEYTANFSPNIWKSDFSMSGKEFVEKYLMVKNVIPNASAVVFKRELVDLSVFSDEFLEMRMCGDWLFWMHLCYKTELTYISQPLNFFRKHDQVSRLHNSSEKKKNRLKEEAVVRRTILKTAGIYNKDREAKLYKGWFALHKFSAITHSDFYSVIMNRKSRLSFILEFLNSKIK